MIGRPPNSTDAQFTSLLIEHCYETYKTKLQVSLGLTVG